MFRVSRETMPERMKMRIPTKILCNNKVRSFFLQSCPGPNTVIKAEPLVNISCCYPRIAQTSRYLGNRVAVWTKSQVASDARSATKVIVGWETWRITWESSAAKTRKNIARTVRIERNIKAVCKSTFFEFTLDNERPCFVHTCRSLSRYTVSCILLHD